MVGEEPLDLEELAELLAYWIVQDAGGPLGGASLLHSPELLDLEVTDE